MYVSLAPGGIRCALRLLGVFFLAHRMPAMCPCLGSVTRCAGSMAQARTSLRMFHDHVWLVLSFVGVSLCDWARCLLRTYQLLCVGTGCIFVLAAQFDSHLALIRD